jgi:protein phosphatase
MDKELHLSFGSFTEAGQVNEFNTDALIEFKIADGHVFIVCDGHNGEHGHGALAAKLIVESIKKYFYNRTYKDMAKALTNAITFANVALFEQAQKDEKYKGMASTLAILIYYENKIYYAYAGDSRIYLYRNAKLQPLTRDHVDDPLNAIGADVKVLIGRSKDIKFGVCKTPIQIVEDDIFLLCTDGLTDQVTDTEIEEIIGDVDKAPEHKAKNLIDLANEKGGNECVSVQVVEFAQVIELQKPKPKMKININFKLMLYWVLGTVALVALGFGGYKGYEAFKNRPVREQVEEIKTVDTKDIEKNKKTKSEGNKTKKEPAKKVSPEAAKPVVAEKKKEPNVKPNLGEIVYYNHEIKFGENLYRIAIRYNVTQKQLIDINGKKAENLISGTKIKIPVKAIHKVVGGESFSSISNKYNVKIKLICAASNIDEATPLREGQILIVPLNK